MLSLQGIVLGFEICRLYISHTESGTGDLVSIGRTYALEGGTDFGLSLGSFICRIESPVGREDEISSFCYSES